jgi:hypothetical protein
MNFDICSGTTPANCRKPVRVEPTQSTLTHPVEKMPSQSQNEKHDHAADGPHCNFAYFLSWGKRGLRELEEQLVGLHLERVRRDTQASQIQVLPDEVQMHSHPECDDIHDESENHFQGQAIC